MADSDAEELSVGAPSPVPNQDNHQQFNNYREADDGRSSGFSTPSSQPRNDVNRGESSSSASQRHPTCALCKNHQQISTLKKHKRYCPYRECPCKLCHETWMKRDNNAKQVALRRAHAQDEELVKKGIIPPFEKTADSPQPSTSSESGNVRNQEYKNRGRDSSTPIPNSRRENPLSRAKSDSTSQIRPSVINCHSSRPAFFGRQLSHIIFIMSESATVWRESVFEDRTLGQDKLQDLFNRVENVMKEINNVSEQLNEIDEDIKKKMSPYRVPVNPLYLQGFLPIGSNYYIPQSQTRDPLENVVSYLAFQNTK